MRAFEEVNRDEMLNGHIVLSVSVDMHKRDKKFLSAKSERELAAIKDRLDCLHRRGASGVSSFLGATNAR
jgi:hypothetical protein